MKVIFLKESFYFVDFDQFTNLQIKIRHLMMRSFYSNFINRISSHIKSFTQLRQSAMQTSKSLQKEFLPKLRQKLASQFEGPESEDPQQYQTSRNFLIRWAINTKNLIQNSVAFLLTMVFFIPLWLFKIGLNGLDLIERWIRFVVWLYVKVFILMINFVFKLLKIFKITSAVNFFNNIVRKYLGTYSAEDADQGENNAMPKELINKKQHQLIDAKKVQKKIRTPNIFLTHEQNQRPTFLSPEREHYRERINQDLVPERTVQENIVETSHRIKNPTLTSLAQSHFRLKRVATEPRFNTNSSLQLQIPQLNRENTTQLSLSHRVQPDRDVSPSFYDKENMKFTESSFKKKETPEKQILLNHDHPTLQRSQTQKHQLQIQLLNLRTKISEVINVNNKQIHELEKWIEEKSETISMSRKQNMELLSQIQQLQRENIKKTKAFAEFEDKIKDMEKTLEKQRNLKNGLNEQVEKLEEQIKVKTIEIMSLKEKIKTNFEHLQRMQSIFGHQKLQFEKFPQKQDQPLDMQGPDAQENESKPLRADMMSKEKEDQIQHHLNGNRSEYEASNVKTIGQSENEPEIEEPEGRIQVGSEKQIFQIPSFEDQEAHEAKSTSAVEQHVEQDLEDKINEEQENVEKMFHKVQQTLKKEQKKLQKFQHSKSILLEQVLEKPKPFKEPKLTHQQKQAQWLLENDKFEEDAQELVKIEAGDRKKKKGKKSKNK